MPESFAECDHLDLWSVSEKYSDDTLADVIAEAARFNCLGVTREENENLIESIAASVTGLLNCTCNDNISVAGAFPAHLAGTAAPCDLIDVFVDGRYRRVTSPSVKSYKLDAKNAFCMILTHLLDRYCGWNRGYIFFVEPGDPLISRSYERRFLRCELGKARFHFLESRSGFEGYDHKSVTPSVKALRRSGQADCLQFQVALLFGTLPRLAAV